MQKIPLNSLGIRKNEIIVQIKKQQKNITESCTFLLHMSEIFISMRARKVP